VVQLGSFANPANAERLAGQVRGRGFTASISETGSGSSRMFRVRAGAATTREAADRLAGELAAAGFPGTVARP
jgi:cell division septation protein DedD